MQVTVSARHTEVPENLRVMAEEKIGKLGRFVDGLEHAEVHFSEHKNPRIADKEVCEVTIEGHGHHVRCKVQAADGYQAIDKAYDKLEHQLHKLKTKLTRRHHGKPKAYKKADALGAVAPVGLSLTTASSAGSSATSGTAATAPRASAFLWPLGLPW